MGQHEQYKSCTDEIQMPKSSQESKKRLSQSNHEKSIEDVNLKCNRNFLNSSFLDISMPKSSKEYRDRIAL
jgi:hypothetical protein